MFWGFRVLDALRPPSAAATRPGFSVMERPSPAAATIPTRVLSYLAFFLLGFWVLGVLVLGARCLPPAQLGFGLFWLSLYRLLSFSSFWGWFCGLDLWF